MSGPTLSLSLNATKDGSDYVVVVDATIETRLGDKSFRIATVRVGASKCATGSVGGNPKAEVECCHDAGRNKITAKAKATYEVGGVKFEAEASGETNAPA